MRHTGVAFRVLQHRFSDGVRVYLSESQTVTNHPSLSWNQSLQLSSLPAYRSIVQVAILASSLLIRSCCEHFTPKFLHWPVLLSLLLLTLMRCRQKHVLANATRSSCQARNSIFAKRGARLQRFPLSADLSNFVSSPTRRYTFITGTKCIFYRWQDIRKP